MVGKSCKGGCSLQELSLWKQNEVKSGFKARSPTNTFRHFPSIMFPKSSTAFRAPVERAARVPT